MKPTSSRVSKYKKKLEGKVLPGQAPRFEVAVGPQVDAENFVKVLGVPAIYQNYYSIFAKEVLRIKGQHSGQLAQDEVCVAYTRWDSRGLDAIYLDAIVEHYNFESCAVPPPPVCAWDFKRKLTFSGNVSPANLDDVPVLVHLTAANFDFAKAQNLGQDIRFMDSDTCPSDATPLKHEIENWDQVGQEAWIWVKVPRIDGGSVVDFIYMFYDNPLAPDGQDAPNVWTNSFEMVQHMYDNPDVSTVTGSTIAGIIGNKRAANEPLETATYIYREQQFDGVNDCLDFPTHATMSEGTIEAWLYAESFGNTPVWNINRSNPMAASQFQQSFNATGTIWTGVWNGVAWSTNFTTTNAVPVTTWTYINLTWDATGKKMYFNTTLDPTSHADTQGLFDPLWNEWRFAKISSPWGDLFPLEAKIDEIRLSDVARDLNWITGQWRSETEVLITYGAEEAA